MNLLGAKNFYSEMYNPFPNQKIPLYCLSEFLCDPKPLKK